MDVATVRSLGVCAHAAKQLLFYSKEDKRKPALFRPGSLPARMRCYLKLHLNTADIYSGVQVQRHNML